MKLTCTLLRNSLAGRYLTFPAFLTVLLLAGSCTPSVRNPYEWGGGTSRPREGSRSFSVRFQVSCGSCGVNWQAGTQQAAETATGLWSRTVNVHLMEGEIRMARLFVAPSPGGGGISWARISVNGKVAADERRDSATGLGDQRSTRPIVVETPLPPPPKRFIPGR